jgi:pyruvate kinase
MKRTKIVCTIGPATESRAILKKMILAGMDCARLNFSHGTYQHHKMLISNIRKAAAELDRPVAILADLQGPRIRIGNLPKEEIKLVQEKEIILVSEKNFQFPISNFQLNSKFQIPKIPITYPNLYEKIKSGDKILLDEGLIQLKVLKVKDKEIYCKVLIGGKIISHKSINIPKSGLKIPAITEKDKRDLEFAIKNDVDWVAMSFAKNKKDILHLKKLIKNLEKKYKIRNPTLTIVKIEKKEAVDNFDKILSVVNGVMVARGDLGIEMPLQEVPIIQKMIIEKCLKAAKPVITATQMLLSMVENLKPTRAEVSDVANAVIDHTDCVMLSQESAVGKYPVEAVKTMSRIILDIEKSSFDDLKIDNLLKKGLSVDEATASSTARLACEVRAKAILVATISGETARIVSRFRPELFIIATAAYEKVRRQLALSWGIIPYVLPKCKSVDELISKAVAKAKNKKIIKPGDKIIILGGHPVGKSGNVNLMKIHQV